MPTITTTRLSNGLTVAIEPMSGVRSAAITWILTTGAARDPLDKQGIAAMWDELLMRGTQSLSSRDQADAFDRLGAARSVDAAILTMRLSLTAISWRRGVGALAAS